jgi:hypothetical protein
MIFKFRGFFLLSIFTLLPCCHPLVTQKYFVFFILPVSNIGTVSVLEPKPQGAETTGWSWCRNKVLAPSGYGSGSRSDTENPIPLLIFIMKILDIN